MAFRVSTASSSVFTARNSCGDGDIETNSKTKVCRTRKEERHSKPTYRLSLYGCNLCHALYTWWVITIVFVFVLSQSRAPSSVEQIYQSKYDTCNLNTRCYVLTSSCFTNSFLYARCELANSFCLASIALNSGVGSERYSFCKHGKHTVRETRQTYSTANTANVQCGKY